MNKQAYVEIDIKRSTIVYLSMHMRHTAYRVIDVNDQSAPSVQELIKKGFTLRRQKQKPFKTPQG